MKLDQSFVTFISQPHSWAGHEEGFGQNTVAFPLVPQKPFSNLGLNPIGVDAEYQAVQEF
jgi:hypothetical protein